MPMAPKQRLALFTLVLLSALFLGQLPSVSAEDPLAKVNCSDCKEKKCYVIATDIGDHNRVGKNNVVKEAKSDCEKAGLTPVVIDPAGREDIKKAFQDKCAGEYVVLSHGPGFSWEEPFIDTDAGPKDPDDIKQWFEEAFGRPVHPCVKKVILHSCGNDNERWKRLFGVEKFYAWNIPTPIGAVWWWQFFHSQDPEDLALAPTPGKPLEGEDRCGILATGEEAEEWMEKRFAGFAGILWEGDVNIYASRGEQVAFITGISARDGRLAGMTYSEIPGRDEFRIGSSDLFAIIESEDPAATIAALNYEGLLFYTRYATSEPEGMFGRIFSFLADLLGSLLSYVGIVSPATDIVPIESQPAVDNTGECPADILVEFDQEAYSVGETLLLKVTISDGEGVPMPYQEFSLLPYQDNEPLAREVAVTDASGHFYFEKELDWGDAGIYEFVAFAGQEGCPSVSDVSHILITSTEPEPPVVEPEGRCAATIDLEFDKGTYVVGEDALITVEVHDSLGERIPRKGFSVSATKDGESLGVESYETAPDTGIYVDTGTLDEDAVGEYIYRVFINEPGCGYMVDEAIVTVSPAGEEPMEGVYQELPASLLIGRVYVVDAATGERPLGRALVAGNSYELIAENERGFTEPVSFTVLADGETADAIQASCPDYCLNENWYSVPFTIVGGDYNRIQILVGDASGATAGSAVYRYADSSETAMYMAETCTVPSAVGEYQGRSGTQALVFYGGTISGGWPDSTTFNPYGVDGAYSGLCRAMRSQGFAGGHFARTRCEFTYGYAPNVVYQVDQEACVCRCTATPVGLGVDVAIDVDFPDWQDYASGNTCEKDHWDSFISNLKAHEEGHVERCKAIRGNIETALDTPSESGEAAACQEACDSAVEKLDAEMTRRFNTAMTAGNAEQESYDSTTRHGATQGATLDCDAC